MQKLKTPLAIINFKAFATAKNAVVLAKTCEQASKETGITIKSLRLDKYYSAEYYVNTCQKYLGKVKTFIIPKSNIATIGVGDWSKMVYEFADNTKGFLEEYFQRNQSESGIAEDKKRIGWKLGQKRPDRIDTANILTSVWHNLYWLG